MTRPYQTFGEFFPFYLQQHAKPATRAWHYVGSGLVLLIAVTAMVAGQWWFLLGMPFAGYFFAWASHAFVEKNRPATFTYPLWSLAADFKMFFLALTGRLGPHLKQAGVSS